jgi:hypothetical protein
MQVNFHRKLFKVPLVQVLQGLLSGYLFSMLYKGSELTR